jgi:hypothetical protein
MVRLATQERWMYYSRMDDRAAGQKLKTVSIKAELFTAVCSAVIVGMYAGKLITLHQSGRRDDFYWVGLVLWAAVSSISSWKVLRAAKRLGSE